MYLKFKFSLPSLLIDTSPLLYCLLDFLKISRALFGYWFCVFHIVLSKLYLRIVRNWLLYVRTEICGSGRKIKQYRNSKNTSEVWEGKYQIQAARQKRNRTCWSLVTTLEYENSSKTQFNSNFEYNVDCVNKSMSTQLRGVYKHNYNLCN